MTIHSFIKKRPYLIWYVKDLEDVSESSVVEHVLNYGNFDDFKVLMGIMGVDNMAKIFRKQIRSKRCNYNPKVKNYFSLYFKKYASGNIK
jgi:hypothetical protein